MREAPESTDKKDIDTIIKQAQALVEKHHGPRMRNASPNFPSSASFDELMCPVSPVKR